MTKEKKEKEKEQTFLVMPLMDGREMTVKVFNKIMTKEELIAEYIGPNSIPWPYRAFVGKMIIGNNG